MKKIAAVTMLCLTLSACAVVDLAAHGIKEYEKSRDTGQVSQDEDQPVRQQTAAPTPVIQQTPPVPSGPPADPVSVVPPRESVGVETLR